MKTVKLLEYLPESLRDVKDIKVSLEAEDVKLTQFYTEIDKVMNNQFISTADVNRVKEWEGIMDITPLDSDTLDERRFRVRARYNEQVPYTYDTLTHNLGMLCGEDGYMIDLSVQDFTLTVKLDLGSKKKYAEVEDMLKRITPCNILISVGLLYNTNELLAEYTHAELSVYTHQYLREEVFE